MNLLIAILCILFFAAVLLLVVLNPATVDFHLFFRTYTNVPLAVVLVASLLAGIGFTAFIGVIDGIRLRVSNRRLQKKMTMLEDEIESLRRLPIRDHPDPGQPPQQDS